MVDSIKDVLQKKADKFDEEHSVIERIQVILDEHFNGDVRALKITDNKTLIVTTSSASLASDVRLKQTQLLGELAEKIDQVSIEKLVVRIR